MLLLYNNNDRAPMISYAKRVASNPMRCASALPPLRRFDGFSRPLQHALLVVVGCRAARASKLRTGAADAALAPHDVQPCGGAQLHMTTTGPHQRHLIALRRLFRYYLAGSCLVIIQAQTPPRYNYEHSCSIFERHTEEAKKNQQRVALISLSSSSSFYYLSNRDCCGQLEFIQCPFG